MKLIADKILKGGRVYTCDPLFSWAESVAIKDNRIIFAGSEDNALSFRDSETEIIDLKGKLLMPSFSDLHTHFTLGSLALTEADLRTARSRDEFRERISIVLKNKKPGEWLNGGYWNEELWGDTGLPDKSWLDDLAPENPVFLWRHDLHSALCNSLALKTTAWYETCPDPHGGEIQRSPDGSPTGLVYEKACTLIRDQIPEPDEKQRIAALEKGMALANSLGITNIGDMLDGPQDIPVYFKLSREKRLSCHFELNLPLPFQDHLINAGICGGTGLGSVEFGPMKGFMDGSLGSRTACMKEPFSDRPGNSGYLLEMADPPEKLLERMKKARDAGFNCSIHAIGDKANEILANMYSQLGNPDGRFRNRVEHAQHLTAKAVEEFKKNSLVVSVQPYHLHDDACYVEEALGSERVKGTYIFNSLLQKGIKLMFNTDWPVVELNPLLGIWAAVTRQTSDGKNPKGWVPEEKVSLEAALQAYITTPAWAGGKENLLGKIGPGYYADMVELDRDIFQLPADEIKEARVVRTWFQGNIVFGE